MELMAKVTRALMPKERRIAEEKRVMEKRLRAGGLSRNAAKRAVQAHFKRAE
jgi:hypothetical protein